MKTKLPILLGMAAVIASAHSQELVSWRPNGSISSGDVAAKYAKAFKGANAPPAQKGDIRLVKISYKSRLSDGRKTTLSGLLAIPPKGAPKGLVVFYHGTIANRQNVPSYYKGAESVPEAHLAALAFATGGYAVAMPDYIGLGDHPGFHPFPISTLNCWSGIDLIKPARQVAKSQGILIGAKLFLTGYSQGGGISMWASRTLQGMSDPDYQVAGSAHLSGPYDFSGAQLKSMLERQSNPTWMAARVYFAAYMVRGAQKNGLNIKLEDYFLPSFASYIPYVFNQNLTDQKTIQKFMIKAMQLGMVQRLERILKPEFRKALEAMDTSDPLLKLVAANNGYDWAPKTPTYLFAVDDDFVVTKANTLKAVKEMRSLGVGTDTLRHYILKGRQYNHITGMPPGLALARRFFDGGFSAVPSSD